MPDLITSSDVALLDNHALRRVLNALLEAEADLRGIALADLDTTLRENDKDAGVDARVQWLGSHDVLKVGVNALQYKSGKLSTKELRAEFAKPGVQEVLGRGGFYTLAVSHAYVAKSRDALRAHLGQLCSEAGIDASHCTIIFGDHIARWISRFPSIVIRGEFNKGLPGFSTVEVWRQHPLFRIPFHCDKGREEIIREVRSFVADNSDDNILRIEGEAGVGKSRLALEALNIRGVADRTIYAPDATNPQVLAMVSAIQSQPHASAVIVVDECDREQQETFQHCVSIAAGRIRLICVGVADTLYEPPRGLTKVFRVKRLADDEIREILASIQPGAPREIIDITVRLAGGMVKLATFIADTLVRVPDLALTELVNIPNVQTFLRRFVEATTFKGLQALSLLSRIGWKDEVRVEAEKIAEHVGLRFTDLQAAVKRLKEQGVVLPRGRYLYVSPDLLAISAAAQLWDERGPELIQMVADLPGPDPRRHLLERLTMMAEHPPVRTAVEELLGADGLYKTLQDLDKQFPSEIFRFLTSALPQDAVKALDRLLRDASDEDLLGFRQGRRDVIWAIESLLRWPTTSLRAARVLMRLALCETESFGNNATGILTGYFALFLSGSPVPLTERFVLIDELLQSHRPGPRQLAVRLAASSLDESRPRLARDVDHLSKKPFPPEWRPKTWGEIWETRRKALVYLEQIAQRGDEAAAFARRERLQSVRTLAQGGQVEDAISVLESARPTTDEERRLVMQSCDQIIQVPNLTGEQSSRLRQLRDAAFGSPYFDRLRRWVGRRLHSDFDSQGESGFAAADRRVVDLAEEGYQQGINDAEISWLSSAEAENVWLYGKRLGELDRAGGFLNQIVDSAPDDINCMLLVSYMAGRSILEGADNRESIIDAIAEKKPVAAFGATWRGEPTKDGAERIIRLVVNGRVPASALGVLKYGGWVEKLPAEYAVKMVNLMLSEDAGENGEAVLGIIDHAVRTEAIPAELFGDAIWKALDSRPKRRSHTFDWQWARVAQIVATIDPPRLAEIFVTFFESDETWLDTDSAQGVLRVATQADPRAVWSVIGLALLRDDLTGVRLRIKLNHWYGELIPPEILVEWARQHGRRGFLMAASLLNVKSGHPSDSARLLVREAGNYKEVLSVLFASLHQGAFTGSISAHMEGQLGTLKTLAEDKEPRIRSWAEVAIANAEKSIKRQKLLEEEEEF